MPPEDLIGTLQSLRTRLRLLLVVDGVCFLAVSAIVFLAAVAALDWWVRFPAVVRGIVLIPYTCWAAVWVYRRIWGPVTAPLGLEQLALALRHLTPDYRDRLSSAVAYLRHGGEGSPALWDRLIRNTADSAREVSLPAGLSTRRVARSAAAAVGGVLLLAATATALPRMFNAGWRRAALPWVDVRWPKTAEILPLTKGAVVARGESFTAQMRMRRGGGPRLRAFVTWRFADGRRQRDMMRLDDDGVYRRTLENVRDAVSYWFSAGDDDTRDRPGVLRVVQRPAVASARIIFTPPPYAQPSPPRVQPLDATGANAIRGSHARLEVVPNKPLDRDGSNPPVAYVRFEDGGQVPLSPPGAGSGPLAAEFTAETSTAFSIEMIDAEGFESRDGRRYELIVRQDEPPSAGIVRPRGVEEVTPSGFIDVVVAAEDDLGLSSLVLVASREGKEMVPTADLLAAEAPSASEPLTRVETRHRLNLAAFQPTPGQVLLYAADVRDNFELAGRRHPAVRSAVKRVHVISAAQLADRLRQNLLGVRTKLRYVWIELEASRNETAALVAGPASARPLGQNDRVEAQKLAERLHRLTTRLRHIAGGLQKITERAAANRARHVESAQQADRLRRKLQRTLLRPLSQAADGVARAAEDTEADSQNEALQESVALQGSAAKALREMLTALERWNDFEDIVRKVREILDRQEALARDVADFSRMARTLAGRDAAGFDVDERRIVGRAVIRQSMLHIETGELVDRMGRIADKVQESDRVGAAALKRAAATAAEQTVARAMEEAAESIRLNRLNNAAEHQHQAALGLRGMLATLDQKPDRRLAELSRQLEDVTADLTRLIAAQRGLLERTVQSRKTGDAAEVLKRLSDRQSSLETTTRSLAGRVETTEDEGAAAANEMLLAATRMAAAGRHLYEARSLDAEPEQQAALASLREARALLRQLQRRTEWAMAQRSLAAIVDALVALRQKQSALRNETADVQARRIEQDRLLRAEGLRLNRLAKRQRALKEPLEKIKARIARAVVYRHVCARVGAAMEAASTHLSAHDCPGALEAQERALRSLSRLIGAIEDEPQDDPPRFVESDGGGGGAGRPTPSKPVPTLAELKVLRLLQADVQEGTAALNERLPEALLRSEAQLAEIEKLGHSQREIHELASEMIKMAAKPGGG